MGVALYATRSRGKSAPSGLGKFAPLSQPATQAAPEVVRSYKAWASRTRLPFVEDGRSRYSPDPSSPGRSRGCPRDVLHARLLCPMARAKTEASVTAVTAVLSRQRQHVCGSRGMVLRPPTSPAEGSTNADHQSVHRHRGSFTCSCTGKCCTESGRADCGSAAASGARDCADSTTLRDSLAAGVRRRREGRLNASRT